MATASSRARAALVLLFAACACAAPEREETDESFAPAFAALEAAVDARDDALARRILERVLARGPEGATLAHAEAFGRILDGRALVDALALRLECAPAAEGSVALRLVIESGLEHPVVLHSGPPTLRERFLGVDAAGVEQRVARTHALPPLEDVELSPGRARVLELGLFPLASGGALAVRGSFELDLPAAEIEAGGRALPAMGIPVVPCEEVALAPWLPKAPVEPGELVLYLEGPRFSTAAMLERAVRIEAARRGEALDLLTPLVLASDPWRLGRFVPALRWLSGQRGIGSDGEAWKRWFAARAEARAAEPPALDLPEPVELEARLRGDRSGA